MTMPNKVRKYLEQECQASPLALEQLKQYVALIKQWQKAINLVAPSTLETIWERHILDSAQIFPHLQKGKTIIDLGSGGGLPALVLAILGVGHVTMVESDKRKCLFLENVSRETKINNVTIVNKRIEGVGFVKADYITARALAPTSQLLLWSKPLLSNAGIMFFLKGQDYKIEIENIDSTYNIINHISITDANARLLEISLRST